MLLKKYIVVQEGLVVPYHCVLEKCSLDRNILDRGQCYVLWCNFANNSSQRGQYYVISGSKIVA